MAVSPAKTRALSRAAPPAAAASAAASLPSPPYPSLRSPLTPRSLLRVSHAANRSRCVCLAHRVESSSAVRASLRGRSATACRAACGISETDSSEDGSWLPPLQDRQSEEGGDAAKLMLKNLTYDRLEAWCKSIGEKPSRALQLWRWMYYDKLWMRSLDDTADSPHLSFGRAFRDKLEANATVDGGLQLLDVHTASDGTRKLIFKVTKGPAEGGTIEAVLIPILRSTGRRERITICVSSQLGCAMNCQFCFTGRMGLGGNLAAAQIVEQIVEARRYLSSVQDPTPITNVVFMGMGEPFHNLDAVLAASSIMCHPMGLHISHNKISVSTVGLVPEIERFSMESEVQLAVSLHATTDEVRDWIVPVNRRYPLELLMSTLRKHFPAQPDGSHDRRHVLIEYIMLNGVNDTLEDARRLLQLLHGIEAKVNLILFNPHAGTLFKASSTEQVTEFRSTLIQGGWVCTVRDSRGDDEMAACGQLGDPGQRQSRLPPPILTPPPGFREQLGLPAS